MDYQWERAPAQQYMEALEGGSGLQCAEPRYCRVKRWGSNKSIVPALLVLLLTSPLSRSQQYIISTVAGGLPSLPAPATTASIGPEGIAVDASGNIFLTSRNSVLRLDTSGILSSVAGTFAQGYSGDGGPAANAQLNSPAGLAFDKAGNLYVADRGNGRVRRISPSLTISTVAGGGTFLGDGGPAVGANLDPAGVCVDAGGNIYVADGGNNRIRKVSTNGIITTVAGNGSPFSSGDQGPALNAEILDPVSVVLDGPGDIFIAEGRVVRKVATDGTITTVAGGGTGALNSGAVATSVDLASYVAGVNLDANGDLLIALPTGGIWKVSPQGIISPVASNVSAFNVAIDPAGNIIDADGFNYVRRVAPDGTSTILAGNGSFFFYGDGGPALNAGLAPAGLALDSSGDIIVADSGSNRVRKINSSGAISTLAGGGTGDGGSVATLAFIPGPSGVALDQAENLFIASSANRVWKVTPGGTMTAYAGTGSPGFSGDGGPAINAMLSSPSGVALDSTGNVYIADTNNVRIREVSTDGIVRTAAGVSGGSEADGTAAAKAFIAHPTKLTFDSAGNMFFADGCCRVLKITPGGIVTTVAGLYTSPSAIRFSGDGGPATAYPLNQPYSVAVDPTGNLFIADTFDNRIRKVSTSGTISTVAGNGSQGSSGDGGPATAAELSTPADLALDSSGNIYVADTGNNEIRVLRPTNQSVVVTGVVDAASESAEPVSPGKIIAIYGIGMGPQQLVQNQPSGGAFGKQVAGTSVSVNGISAPVLYSSSTQVAAVIPYEVTGTTAQVAVTYAGETSQPFSVSLVSAVPSFFTINGTGAGQAAAINVADGSINSAANPVSAGAYISLFATGEGQTNPAGTDGALGGTAPTYPKLPVTATVGGVPATVQYAGGVYGDVAGLMQVNVLVPPGVKSGGYVPVVLRVGDATSNPETWIAVSSSQNQP